MNVDGNLAALKAFEDQQEKEEIHYESFCQAAIDDGVILGYDDLVGKFNEIAIRYSIDTSLEDWLKENY